MAWDPFNVTEDADLGTRLRAEPVPLPGARLDNLRGGAAAAIILVPATHALDQGLYADLVLYAAYRAAWQFATGPFTWEKTAHGLVTARKAPRRLRLTQCRSAGSSRLNASAP